MEPVVEISVSESGIPAIRTYTCGVTVVGQKIVSRELSPIESQQIRELYQQYISIFERGCKVEAVKDYMELLGKGLFHLFLEYAWGNLKPRMEFGAEVLVVSKMPEVLGLPWEFLRFPDDSVLAFDNRFTIKRFAGDIGSLTAPGETPSGPLRILFMACAPYDYGYEERSLLRAIEGLDVIVRICDTGNFEELKKEAASFRPHLVHLVGQGKIKENSGYFAFEAEAGRPDFQDASSLGSVLAPAGVRCLLLGGCQLDTPQSLDLICFGLGGKIPLVLSWNALAESTSAFYRTLAVGQKIEQAIQASILEIKKIYIDHGLVCALPTVYYFSTECQLFNLEKRSKYFSTHREQITLKGLTEGYAEDFVDRRNDLQRLSSALREGTARVLIVTGPDGVGKSVLAKRLVSRLASEGYALISVYSSNHNALTTMRILEAYISSLAEGELAEKAMSLRDGSISISFSERLKRLLEALNKDKLLLFLDGLDLDENTGRIKDQELAEFYYEMLRQVDKSRMIITARTLPADAMTLPGRCWEWNLGGLPESAFINYLLNEDAVAECYRIGTLSYNQLESLSSASAGQPFCLAQMRKALSKGWMGNGSCEEAVQFLFGLLSHESGQALSRSAVYGIAVSISGLAQVSGEPENTTAIWVEEWKNLSLVFQPNQNLWAVSASFRSWLLNQLDT
ncbi:MAG: ATP-binding protein, partial [Methanotrichaceae archaeon]|nr:ATP-binding protein [Methanotrichaceae archaeon]